MTPFFGLVVNLFLMLLAIWSISEAIIKSTTYLQDTKYTITSKGYRVIVCALGVVFFSYWKDCNYENTQKAEKEIARQKDSTNKDDIVKAVADNSAKIAKALVEYHLSFDTQSNKIIKIVRDSLKRGYAPASEPDPFFTLELVPVGQIRNSIRVKEIRENVDSLYMKMGVFNSDVYDLTYYSFVLIPFDNDTIVIENLVDKNINVLNKTVLSVDMVTHRPLHLLDLFWLKFIGTYKSKNGKKFYLDETYYVRPKTGEYQTVSGFNVDILKELVKRKSKIAKKFYERGSF